MVLKEPKAIMSVMSIYVAHGAFYVGKDGLSAWSIIVASQWWSQDR